MIAGMRSGLNLAALFAAATTLGCNEGLRPTVCPGICGVVTYQGSLPDSLKDSTAAVLIIAYGTFPQAPADLLRFEPAIPAFVDTGGPPRRYVLQVPRGTYDWVLAVWEKKGGSLSAQNADSLLREVGFYRDGGDTTSHGTGRVHVTSLGADSVNFVIDFTKMHRICDYFPPCS